ncbi:hypothetical protein, unlikely [Trypanosoma brucei gambiense DAL972]|uniref:Uncharacterized protein n=1 Tax=Trypanosoma brucei gambiense (strain MHOM/CI/86/DAL972) TaxID=679716 RepID=C9ZUS4_TRYB9|nr:hypothetical protein, unlikely [Trypanosoma brucei gambiense DAL972]CBH13162.1 hypothetical protein, unlikely [Trypanosoma brucei gambiense DAL972]|eukprot:XP_011775439.1 hypothetical protein, unlikely [Trypanosoma brucei gambiense DAL972]
MVPLFVIYKGLDTMCSRVCVFLCMCNSTCASHKLVATPKETKRMKEKRLLKSVTNGARPKEKSRKKGIHKYHVKEESDNKEKVRHQLATGVPLQRNQHRRSESNTTNEHRNEKKK